MKPEQAQLHAEIERRALEGLLDAANAFYENPANKQAFEAWKNSEEAKQYADHLNNRPDGREPGKTESIL
ncbi:hypothetical protein [Acutalibacter muris]|jgi:hypothetical protein|uniref:hypothetical protein n=1 Tax=Acutalibacter muris TaxID=1796620 RepID=UPI00272BAAA1|nr:hypothetical protein [Acutalibacter muris]